jgi:hypothetical protein
MIHCAIIGAGQIGSRHLQALCHLESPIRIDLVDPSDESLRITQGRYEEVMSPGKQGIELHRHNNMDDLPETLDLVIVATNSIVREKAIREVTEKRCVKHLLLEKILFQRVEQYVEFDKFLKQSTIPTWVNCWMRTADLFKQIKSDLNLDSLIQVKVEGSQWRMGTSSLHFMDLFTYFTGCGDFSFTETQFSNELIGSRRKGFQEFKGEMKGKNSRGDSLDLICLGPEDESPTVEIINGSENYKITGLGGKVGFESTNGLASRVGKASLPPQSQLTHIWAKDIFEKGSCDLPTYAESMPLHLELIRVFTSHLEKITGKEIDACPIT